MDRHVQPGPQYLSQNPKQENTLRIKSSPFEPELCTLQGWAGFAAQPIRAGSFVCQYAGELLTSAAATARLAEYDQRAPGPGHALLVRLPAIQDIASVLLDRHCLCDFHGLMMA